MGDGLYILAERAQSDPLYIHTPIYILIAESGEVDASGAYLGVTHVLKGWTDVPHVWGDNAN